MRHELKHGRRPHDVFSSQLIKQRNTAPQAFSDRITLDERRERVCRAFVRHANHHDLADVRRAQPRRLNWTIASRQISIAIHRRVARDQTAHRMRDDVELQIRTLQFRSSVAAMRRMSSRALLTLSWRQSYGKT